MKDFQEAEPDGYWFRVKVYIPDPMGGTYTWWDRFGDSPEDVMNSVQEENPDVNVCSAVISHS